jgi:hypothetical protein
MNCSFIFDFFFCSAAGGAVGFGDPDAGGVDPDAAIGGFGAGGVDPDAGGAVGFGAGGAVGFGSAVVDPDAVLASAFNLFRCLFDIVAPAPASAPEAAFASLSDC